MHEFENFNYKFSITKTETLPQDLHANFVNEMSLIDKILVHHYLDMKFNKTTYFLLFQEELKIGYGCGVEDNGFLTVYELYILPQYRELGLGTSLFDTIRDYCKSQKLKIRSVTLPSDRIGKNFYESNLITARALIMEEKRENTRYRP